MDLKETIEMMLSNEYKERFKAEYYQLKIRYDKLDAMLIKFEAGALDFKPTCPIELLLKQKNCMADYILILEERARIEGIEL